MSLFKELKRRNVFKVMIAYIAIAWLVLQVADVILNNITAPGWIFHVLLLFLAIGLPFAVFFAWAFELTPEGLKREHEVDRTQSITPHTGKKLNLIFFAVMTLALGYFAYDKFVLDASRDAALVESVKQEVIEQSASAESEKSIAVLPFVNMSSDKEQDYFSDGLSEELLNLLAKIPELRVIARTSSFAYKDKDIKISDVARELNVGHVLEGSVRKAGNQVRITAQLIRASDSSHLWSETYDRSLDNIFAIQDEIAATVVKQLKITLLGAPPKVHEADPEAYALYLQARHLSRQFTKESLEQSNALYQQALAIDPDFANAWAGLAANYANQAGKTLLPVVEGYALAREAANKALSINPDYAPAEAYLGWIATIVDNDLTQAARHFERALALDPANTDIIGNATTLLLSLGHLDESIALREYVIARDPINSTLHSNLGWTYFLAGRWDEAIESFQTTLRLSPDRIGVHYRIGLALLFKGESQAALAEFSLEGDEEYRAKGKALALHALGCQEEYRAKLVELIERLGAEWPSEVAHVYAFAADADAAFEWLDKAVGQNEAGLHGQFLNPIYTPLHGDPRWAEFLVRVSSSPEQLDAIKFKVTLPK